MKQKEAPVRFSFVPNEVVNAGTTLSLHFDERINVEPEDVNHVVAVHQSRQQCDVHATLDHDEGGNHSAIKISTDKLQPGTHQIEISHLCSASGQTICEPTSIPITIGAIKGKVPDHLRVEHVVYGGLHDLGCKRLKPGAAAAVGCQYVEFVKCVDRNTSKVERLAFDCDGNQVDVRARLSSITARRQEVYGCLHPILKNACDSNRDTQPLDIVIVPALDYYREEFSKLIKENAGSVSEPHQTERAWLEKMKEARAKVISALDGADNVDKLDDDSDSLAAYFVNARLRVQHIRDLSNSRDIGTIFLKDSSAALDLVDSMTISRANQAQAPPLSYTGNGVKVAVYEDGPSNLNQLSFAGQYLSSPPISSTPDHARLTSAIIKNTQTTGPKGYAPNCSLFSANSRDVAAVDWATRTQGCTVVSQSFHRVAGLDPFDEQTVGTMSFDDVLKDWLAIQSPYPTIVHASGNGATNEYVNHKGFNTISVGSHTDDARAMIASSVFKNPISPNMDRELPEITANGNSVTAIGLTNSGTSFAAPAVAGTVALMQEAGSSARLQDWPEASRAILFASADRNISGGTWWNDVSNRVDAADGAGALNAEGACKIAGSHQVGGNSPTQFGWDAWTLTTSEVGPDTLSTSRHWIAVPNPFAFPTLWRYTVKVALAFSSFVSPETTLPVWGGATETSDLNIDLDLIVRDSAGNQVANSSSFDNSYEIVEFPGRIGETYEIIVKRVSGTRNVYVGVAWGVWGGLNVLNPLPLPGTNPLPRPIPTPVPGPGFPVPRPDPPPFVEHGSSRARDV